MLFCACRSNKSLPTNVAPLFQDSDGEKSDDLVVDVSNEVRRAFSCSDTFLNRKAAKNPNTALFCLSKPQHLSLCCQNVWHNIGCVLWDCLLGEFPSAIHAEYKTKNTKRKGCDRWMRSACICVRWGTEGSMSIHRDIYLCLHMRPQLVWPTCKCQWLSSGLFAQSCTPSVSFNSAGPSHPSSQPRPFPSGKRPG